VLNNYLQQIDLLRLESFLTGQPEPVYESILLGEFCPQLNQINGAAIELYRWHFALFHQLYRLKDRIVASNQYLHIHFMGIHLTAYPQAGECRHYEDSCFCRARIEEDGEMLCEFHRGKCEESALAELSDRYFYLDHENFFALTEENAEAFIAGAWNLLVNYDEVQECYKTLGLPEGTELRLIKRHFRELARLHHPDLKPESGRRFAEINSAYRRLLGYLSTPKL